MVSLLLSTSLLVSAGPKQKKVDNWIDASVKQKSELRASLVKVYSCIKFKFRRLFIETLRITIGNP